MLDPAQSDQKQLYLTYHDDLGFGFGNSQSDTSRSYTIWPATIVSDIMWWSWFRSSSTIWSDTSRSYTMPKCHKASSRRVTASPTSHFALTQGAQCIQRSEKGMKPELIFVTYITDYICGENSVMWRNFRFLYRIWTIVGVLSKFMPFLL